MSRKLVAFMLNRAGWGKGQSLDLDVRRIKTTRALEILPNLLRIEADEPLSDILSWPDRSGCALQCQYELGPAERSGPHTLMAAEAVKSSPSGNVLLVELVRGWPGEPYYWGERPVHEEEVEAAIHGIPPHGDLQLLSVPAGREAADTPRARILRSKADTAVLFIAASLEEARILSGVVERLCDTGVLVQRTCESHPLEGSAMAGTDYQRTTKKAPVVTRWLGGYGTRSQQTMEQRSATPWPTPQRWSKELR